MGVSASGGGAQGGGGGDAGGEGGEEDDDDEEEEEEEGALVIVKKVCIDCGVCGALMLVGGFAMEAFKPSTTPYAKHRSTVGLVLARGIGFEMVRCRSAVTRRNHVVL